jgi:hypothetical protein
MEETFKTAISRLTFGAIQGAIGGAAVGAVAGAILMSVNRNAMVGADASSLPIRVDYAWRDSEIVSMILAVLDIMPASAEEHRRGLVAAVDQLVGCSPTATFSMLCAFCARTGQTSVRLSSTMHVTISYTTYALSEPLGPRRPKARGPRATLRVSLLP